MSDCHHRWQPYADAKRVWQVCVACGAEQHVTTHEAQLMRTLADIFHDVPPKTNDQRRTPQ